MQDTADSWARNITGQHLVYATMEAGTGSRNITLDGGTSIEPISQITGGRRYPFNIEGQFVLMKNMTCDEGRHEFVNNSPSRGPNVFLDGVATNGHADSGTHQRWSTGTLWDNITTNTDINVQNRYASGTGHGWSGRTWLFGIEGQRFLRAKSPHGAELADRLDRNGAQHVAIWAGEFARLLRRENSGSKVTLNGETSLYRAQLNQRIANPHETKLEYWVGDFDSYANDGASDQLAVDPAWLAAVHALQPRTPTAGFDSSFTGVNIDVPFTVTFDVPQQSRITSATLTMAVHAVGTAATRDRIWLESTIQLHRLQPIGHDATLGQ